MSTIAAVAPSLTATERREFIRIIKGRFNVLRMQVKSEAYRVLEQERRRVVESRRSEIDGLTKKAKKINDRYQALKVEAGDLREEVIAAGFGLAASAIGQDLLLIDMGRLRIPTRYEQSDEQYRRHEHYSRSDDGSVLVATMLAELARQEQAALEPLVLGNLATNVAREFLASLPTIDSLIGGWNPPAIEAARP